MVDLKKILKDAPLSDDDIDELLESSKKFHKFIAEKEERDKGGE